jgi:predicted nucleic acid-binding protein
LTAKLKLLGELLFGAKKSGRAAANQERPRHFIQACDNIEIDQDVAKVYADI